LILSFYLFYGLGFSPFIIKRANQNLFFNIFFILKSHNMKLTPLILLFPFAVFLTETAVLPLEIKSECSEMSCMKMKKMMGTKCHGKKENQESSGKCNNIPECSFCPVCFLFTFQPQYEWSPNYFSLKKSYRSINTGDVSSYIPPVWKPPNSYSL
jgi:hypothetical protein